jgi:hypothetical protein
MRNFCDRYRYVTFKRLLHFDKNLSHVTGKGSNEEVFLGTESPPSQSASVSFSDQAVIRVECRPGDEEVRN